MTTYRVGTHHGVTIVRSGDGGRCGRPDHDCERGHLAAVVIDGGEEGDQELAERICALLNGDQGVAPTRKCGARGMAMGPGCIRRAGHEGGHGYSDGSGEQDSGLVAADSCTCTKVGPDPACPVHHGRRARGPRPPYLGPGCNCDGSGRACPRHGVVI